MIPILIWTLDTRTVGMSCIESVGRNMRTRPVARAGVARRAEGARRRRPASSDTR